MPNPAGDSMVMEKLNLRKRGKIIEAITLLVCLLLLSGTAYATAIYDNLTPTYGGYGYDPLNGWEYYLADGSVGRVVSPSLFDSFTVGPNDFNLLDVKLMLKTTSSGSSGSFSVSIYNNDSSDPSNPKPGSLLTTIKTMSDSKLLSSFAIVDFLLAKHLTLNANTRYWLVLDSAGDVDSTAGWSWSPYDQNDPGVINEYFGNLDRNSETGGYYISPNDTTYDGIQYGPYQMRLSDTPLPPSLLLLGSGLAGLGLLRFRKRFKA
jgi:hypothetical protein